MFPRVKGNPAYLDHLKEAARTLYRELRQSDAVLAAVGKPVTVDNRSLGQLKPFPERSPQPRIEALRHLLHSLSHIASRPVSSTRKRLSYVAIPMANEAFGIGTEYDHLQRDAFRQIVLALLVYSPSTAGTGWLEHRPARHNRETSQGDRTRVTAARPMLDWMTRHQLVFPYHPHGPDTASKTTALLRLKLEDEGETIPLDRPLDLEEEILPVLNQRLARQRLSWSLRDYAEYERHFDFRHGQPPALGGRKRLYRQFRSQDGRGGRLYGHWVQVMPSTLRSRLLIHGKPIVELDYGNMQLRLLYAVQGVLLAHHGDLYQVPGSRFGREEMKTVAMRTIGNPNRAEALQSIRGQLHKDNLTGIGKAEELFDTFWGHHAGVDPFPDGGAAWPVVQNLESRIALRILRQLVDQGITAIPIHDGFVVQALYEEQLRQAMESVFADICPGISVRIDKTAGE